MCAASYCGALSAHTYGQMAINCASMARLSVAILWTWVPIVARIIAICRLYDRANALIIALMAVIPILRSILDRNRLP